MDRASHPSDPLSTSWTPPSSKTWTLSDGQNMLAAHRASGLSITAFIKQNKLSAQRYYYWRDKLANRTKPSRVPKPSTPAPIRKIKLIDSSRLISVVSADHSAAPLQAWIGDVRIQVEARTCVEALKKLLQIARHREKDGDDSTR